MSGQEQRAQTETHEIPAEHKKTLLYSDCGWTLQQVAWKGRGISVLKDIQNSAKHGPGQRAPAGPASEGGWTRWSRESASTRISVGLKLFKMGDMKIQG